MDCPSCNKAGISTLRKSITLPFGLSLRCHQCGTQFRIKRGFAFLLAITLEIVFVVGVVMGLKALSVATLLLVIVLGLLITFSLAAFLPMEIESQFRRFNRRAK